MEAAIEGVVKEIPAPNDTPPVDAAYQLIVPAEGVAPRLTVPVLQRLAGVVAEMVGVVFTVAITAVLEVVVQPVLVAST